MLFEISKCKLNLTSLPVASYLRSCTWSCSYYALQCSSSIDLISTLQFEFCMLVMDSWSRLLSLLIVLGTISAALSTSSYATTQFGIPRPCVAGKYQCFRSFFSRFIDCIPGNRRCDGHPDCPFDDDERNCSKWHGSFIHSIVLDHVTCDTVCPDGEFQCLDNTCISGSERCNGIHDCSSGEDELHCGKYR